MTEPTPPPPGPPPPPFAGAAPPPAPPRRDPAVRRRVLVAAVAVALVLIVVVSAQIVPSGKPANHNPLLPAGTLSALTAAPVRSSSTGLLKSIALPRRWDGQRPLTTDGKPEVLFIGAEFCPMCAAARWPMVLALSRFGSFSDLAPTTSSGADSYPNTPTFTFRSATYRSDYLVFTPVEAEDRDQHRLTAVTAGQQAIWAAGMGTQLGFPFVSFANRYQLSGASFDPAVLSGKTFDAIASDAGAASGPAGQQIDAAADAYTAVLCRLTGDRPADICQAAPIPDLATQIDAIRTAG